MQVATWSPWHIDIHAGEAQVPRWDLTDGVYKLHWWGARRLKQDSWRMIIRTSAKPLNWWGSTNKHWEPSSSRKISQGKKFARVTARLPFLAFPVSALLVAVSVSCFSSLALLCLRRHWLLFCLRLAWWWSSPVMLCPCSVFAFTSVPSFPFQAFGRFRL